MVSALLRIDSNTDVLPTFDISEDLIGEALARDVLAASLLLNDGRFPDLRSDQDRAEGYPVSMDHCIPAALFLAAVLKEIDPTGGWEAVGGHADHEWHAFAVGHGGALLADITGDQFEFAPAILTTMQHASEYVPETPLSEVRAVSDGDRRRAAAWLKAWHNEQQGYRQSAALLLSATMAEAPQI